MDKKSLLSTLWICLSVNYIFCDVFTLMHAPDLQKIIQGEIDGMVMNQQFLVGFAIVMEIPLLMILLSRVLKYKLNRNVQLIAASILFFLQAWSMSVGNLTLHYIFFSVVEITLLSIIILISIKWIESGK